jgi:uncharacterized membrane protein (UPF0182 family)
VAFRSPGNPRPAVGRPIVLPRWPRFIIPVAVGVIAAIVLLFVIAGVWTDFLWFHAIGYSRVFGISYGTKWALFIVAALFMTVVVGLNGALAYRVRPEPHAGPGDHPGLEAYRLAIDPHRKLVFGLLLGLIGLVSGISAAGDWRIWLMFANRTPFNIKDPQFKLDISFFVFVYPFLRMLLSYLFAAV